MRNGKIVILEGTSCVGKTTLCESLKKQGWIVLPEAIRYLEKETGKIGDKASPIPGTEEEEYYYQDQLFRIERQKILNANELKKQGKNVVIDKSAIATVATAKAFEKQKGFEGTFKRAYLKYIQMLQELRDNGLIECDVFILLTADYDVICKRNNMRKHMLEGIWLEEETIINQRYVLEKIVADINSLKNTDVFICRIDGLSFDAGIGFELGYCLGKECLLYVFSTDFIRAKIFERKFIITNIVDRIANSFYYEYKNRYTLSYEDNLKENINEFTKFVTDKIDKYEFQFKNKHINNKQYDVFIDFCGHKYQWNELLLNSIVTELEKNGITYWISDRYKVDYDFEKDISALDNSRIYLTCFDENEPDFDSCVLQGYAYYKNKYIIGYESNNITYFVEGGQTMGVNLMVEQSCNIILKSYTKIVNKIMELKNEKEK